MDTKQHKNSIGGKLRLRGFDLTTYDRSSGHWRVRCSQCEAAVINGIACHEQGCPNKAEGRNERS